MERLLKLLMATGWRRGVRGNSRLWLAAGAVAWLLNRARSRRSPATVYLDDLLPGEALVVTHHPAPR